MKKIIVTMMAICGLVLASCSDHGEKSVDAINGFKKGCKGTVSAELHIGSIHNKFALYCDNFKIEEE